MLRQFLICASIMGSAWAAVPEHMGSPLQMYSYHIDGLKPVIDGSPMSRDGDPSTKETPDEWKESYTRTLTLADGQPVQFFVSNSNDSLYVAFLYEHGNDGNGAGVSLYFDTDHDGQLGAKDLGFSVVRNGSSSQKTKLAWDGTSWSAAGQDANSFRADLVYYNDSKKIHAQEFAIPISALGSKLDREIGVYFEVHKFGSGAGNYAWNKIGSSLSDASKWADLRLDISDLFLNFYSSYNPGMPLSLDGKLGEQAWNGAYRRDITLSNYAGKTVPATFYALQDFTSKKMQFAIQVQDNQANNADFGKVYLESKNGQKDRNYTLETGLEDALALTSAGTVADQNWNGTAWANDVEAADAHGGITTISGTQRTLEFALPYAAANEDIDVPNNGRLGFQILWHDADQAAGEQDYYWDYAANADAFKIDPNGNTYLSIGWPTLQMGAPFVQPIYPQDNGQLEGISNVRILAATDTSTGNYISSAQMFRLADTSAKINLTRIAGTQEWAGTYDVSKKADGLDTLVARVSDANGITIDRLIVYRIANTGTATSLRLSVISPKQGITVRDTVPVRYNVTGGRAQKVEVSVDGADFVSVSDSLYQWPTRNWIDGSHQLLFQVTDSSGNKTQSLNNLYVVDNSAPNLTLPKLNLPVGQSVLRPGDQALLTTLVWDQIAGVRDSGVVFRAAQFADSLVVLHDDGQNGDAIAGDKTYSAYVKPVATLSGKIPFALTATDKLGNQVQLVDSVWIDNAKPKIGYQILPSLRGVDSLHGQVYSHRILVKGWAMDSLSGVDHLTLSIVNDSGKAVNNSPEQIQLLNGEFSRLVELVPGRNHLRIAAVDKAGNSDTLASMVEYVLPVVTQRVGVEGDSLVSPDGAKLIVPAKALFSSTELTMKVVDPLAETKPEQDNLVLLGVPREFGPHGIQFRKPVTLTLVYTDLDLDRNQDGKADLDPSKLQMVYWDGQSWIKAGAPKVDTLARTVSITTNHFSLYDLAVDTSAIVERKEINAYWTRNPVKKDQAGSFVIEYPTAENGDGTISLSILDLAGDLVLSLIPANTKVADAPTTPSWNGMNAAGAFAGAGLYVYVMDYKGSNGTKKLIRKPIAVLRD